MRPADNTITVELPRLNPFGEAPSRNRSGAQSGGRQPAARSSRRYQSDEHDEFEDEEYDARRTNVTQLPNVNPFGREEPSRSNRQGGQSGARQSVRRQARVRSDDEEDGSIVNLPHVNPFAVGGNRNPPRIIEPIYPPDEPEPEEEDFEEEEEEVYSPPPVPRSARTLDNSRPSLRTSNLDRPQANGRQRGANSRNQRPSAGPQEDDRLVISWVDEALASPPRSPAHRHGHHHSSASSESESYFALPPQRPRSVRSASPGHGQPNSHNSHHRDHRPHHHHGHHSHHDRSCHQCNHLVIPPWQPPFPMPPADWSGYGGPRSPYSPAPPYPYPRPLYANIPDLPSLLDQVRVPYPPVPVAPVAFLRTLRPLTGTGAESPTLMVPTVPIAAPITLEEWKSQLTILATKPEPFLTQLKQQEFDPAQVDRVFRKLTDVVQVRFGERQGNEIVNRVHVVPRGRLAMGTVIVNKPKIDVDLVIPSDFILRRWNTTASETDDLRPKTIADALELNPVSINRGEITSAKLNWVFQAVWEQLNGSADGSIFPGGRDEAERYLPKNWCTRYKENVTNSNRLALKALDVLQVNIFVKVSLSLYGQDIIVGVDQSSAFINDRYQLVKTPRIPGVPLSEPTLSPNLRTAILILCWSQRVFGIIKGSSPIRASHFHLALTALRKLEPSDSIFSDGEAFSLPLVLKAIIKILTFLGNAYKYQPPIIGAGHPFPLSSCTLMDTLRLQASSIPLAPPATVLFCLAATLGPFFMIEKLLQGASGALGSALDAASKAGGSGLGGGGTESNEANPEASKGPGESGGSTTEGALPAANPTEDVQPSAQPENETSSSNSNSNAAPVAEGSTRGNRPPGPANPTSPTPKAQGSSGPVRISSGGDPRKPALKK